MRARAGVEEGLAAEVIERDGERLRLGHPLLAEAISHHTSPSEWRALHRRLADLAREPEQRARHLAEAAAGPDAAAAAALDAASELAAARGAPADAAELAERAAELTPGADVGSRARRIMAAADAHMISGDGRRAERVLRPLISEVPPSRTRSNAMRRLAYVVSDGTDISLLQQALTEAGDDDALQADIHMDLAVSLSMREGVGAAILHADAAVRLAERDGAASLVSRALVTLQTPVVGPVTAFSASCCGARRSSREQISQGAATRPFLAPSGFSCYRSAISQLLGTSSKRTSHGPSCTEMSRTRPSNAFISLCWNLGRAATGPPAHTPSSASSLPGDRCRQPRSVGSRSSRARRHVPRTRACGPRPRPARARARGGDERRRRRSLGSPCPRLS